MALRDHTLDQFDHSRRVPGEYYAYPLGVTLVSNMAISFLIRAIFHREPTDLSESHTAEASHAQRRA